MAEVVFCKSVTPGDPNERPCTILGKPKNLESLPFSAVAPFLAPRVTEEVVISTFSNLNVYEIYFPTF